MAKIMILYAILTAFIIDFSMKSVCSYNNKLKKQITETKNHEINNLGQMTLKFDAPLDCSNMDKPFVYKKQIDQIQSL